MEKEPYRFYIKTRTLLGVTAATIHEELTIAYGAQAISYSTVQKWSKFFREGNMEIEDDPRSGRPVSKINSENIQLVQKVIDEDPHSTYDDIEAETQLSRGTIYRIIHDHLRMKKVTSRWVPHELTLLQKQLRVKICRENLTKLRNHSWRMCDIITGDETWIYYRQTGRKASNACWIGEGQSPETVVRRSQHEPKILFSIFFRSNGPLLVHSVDRGVKIDRFYYIDNCLKTVVEEVKKQRPKTGTHGIKMLHDNASSHGSPAVEHYLKQEGINLMPHPPYSPDLSPCDYWLNDYIKRNLTDQTNAETLHKAVSNIVFSIPEKEYKKTFDRLIERMELCIDNNGNYFEHLIE
jgi:histone-lysine N-methyltransferase SETMAR